MASVLAHEKLDMMTSQEMTTATSLHHKDNLKSELEKAFAKYAKSPR